MDICIGRNKKLRQNADIVASLINLRNELFNKHSARHAEVFYKINSCLYAEYPTAPRAVEMTIADVESALGHRVAIVKDRNRDNLSSSD